VLRYVDLLMVRGLSDTEEVRNTLHRNVGKYLLVDSASYPRSLKNLLRTFCDNLKPPKLILVAFRSVPIVNVIVLWRDDTTCWFIHICHPISGMYIYIYIYRMSQEECARLRESVP